MKKTRLLLCLVLVLVTVLLLTSCSLLSGSSSQLQDASNQQQQSQGNSPLETVYLKAQSLGFTGTLDEFLELCKGVDGKGISKVEINADGNFVVYYTDAPGTGIVIGPSGTCQHTFSEWLPGEPARCCSMGYELRVCGNCSDLDYQFLPALGHRWSPASLINADTQPMLLSYCTTCGGASISEIDPAADYDGDGIPNGEELDLGTHMLKADTDGDGLDDKSELTYYGTNPLLPDTDGDGALDGVEVDLGFDPLTPQTSFEVTLPYTPDPTETPDMVTPSLDIDVGGDQLNTLTVERDYFFEQTSLGYMGDAYKYEIEGEITSATIDFSFDNSSLSSDALPTIYEFNEETKELTPLQTDVSGNTASAEVDKLSTYVLLDRRVYEASLTWVDRWEVGNGKYTGLEIVFVVDDSGSMDWNDEYNQRLSVARDLVGKLPQNTKVGVVKFESSTTVLCQLTDNIQTAQSYFSTSYFYSSGGTYMYEAINSSLSMYQSTDASTMKIMVVLSDGETSNTSKHASTINAAAAAGVKIYTIGLGSSSSNYFTNYLKPLAEQTGGKFYLSANASELAGIYDDIGEKIDLVSDGDGDGLCDYYEDNMVVFDGNTFAPDKTNPDTDGDGLKDGEEIQTVVVYSLDGKKMTILGKVYSDPTKVDTDGDGINDKDDPYPMIPA